MFNAFSIISIHNSQHNEQHALINKLEFDNPPGQRDNRQRIADDYCPPPIIPPSCIQHSSFATPSSSSVYYFYPLIQFLWDTAINSSSSSFLSLDPIALLVWDALLIALPPLPYLSSLLIQFHRFFEMPRSHQRLHIPGQFCCCAAFFAIAILNGESKMSILYRLSTHGLSVCRSLFLSLALSLFRPLALSWYLSLCI